MSLRLIDCSREGGPSTTRTPPVLQRRHNTKRGAEAEQTEASYQTAKLRRACFVLLSCVILLPAPVEISSYPALSSFPALLLGPTAAPTTAARAAARWQPPPGLLLPAEMLSPRAALPAAAGAALVTSPPSVAAQCPSPSIS